MRYLVTGGAGFIGAAVVERLLAEPDAEVTTLDKLTYAAHPHSVVALTNLARHRLLRGDVAKAEDVALALAVADPDVIVHLAAESHVDRSIDAPADFIQTNVVGTFTLLEGALRHWSSLPVERRAAFRFLHVSTDEVFGSLGAAGCFDEASPYLPTSPYAASKAAADHLVRAWHATHGLPVIVTNCTNNYGPRQYPEKLIPLLILRGMQGLAMPLYGDGQQVRDWLHVADHADALARILARAPVGSTYMIGGGGERTNLEIAGLVCRALDRLLPRSPNFPHERLITFVADRPGHDRRYAADSSRLRSTLGWLPGRSLTEGLKETVCWYLDNPDWCRVAGEGAVRRQGRAVGDD